jgi:dephospho-CoA kinase
MLKVGLTGGIASGKSTISEMFRRLGAHIVDADQVSRRVVEPGTPALQEISERFGEKVIRSDGSLDRSALGNIVFQNAEALARLNSILHPRIWEEEARLFELYEAQDPDGIVLLDAAVLIEAGAAGRMDLMVVVDVDEDDQLRRLVGKGMPREEALSRIRSQMPTAEKLTYADYVIDNRGPLAETERQVDAIWAAITLRTREKTIDK